MCKCTPNIKTPFCGKGDCQWPPQPIEKNCKCICHQLRYPPSSFQKKKALDNGYDIKCKHCSPPQPSLQSSSDILPHKHGSEGTHSVCQEMLDKYGGKATCCQCNGHKCKSSSEDKEWEEEFWMLWHDRKPYQVYKSFIKSLLIQQKEKMIGKIDEIINKFNTLDEKH